MTMRIVTTETSSVDESNPDLISHTPDPAQLQSDQDTGLSTIASSSSSSSPSCILLNGGRIHSPRLFQTRVLDLGQISFTRSAAAPPSHNHDTTCLNTPAHAHICLTSAAIPQVPYLHGFQQGKIAGAELPNTSTHCPGCQIVSDIPPLAVADASYNPYIFTLGRRKKTHHNCIHGCPHLQSHHLKCPPCESTQQVFLTNLLHQDTFGIQTPLGSNSRTYYGSQFNLTDLPGDHDASLLPVNDPSLTTISARLKSETKESICIRETFQRKSSNKKKKSQHSDILWSVPPAEKRVHSPQSGESISVVSPYALRNSDMESSV